jgi:hypothetical protein
MRLPEQQARELHVLAHRLNVRPEDLIVDALAEAVAPLPGTSRAAREGRYVGVCVGKHVRWHKGLRGLRKRLRSAKARAIMARRTYAANGVRIPGWAVE